jgi:hypothetical protein
MHNVDRPGRLEEHLRQPFIVGPSSLDEHHVDTLFREPPRHRTTSAASSNDHIVGLRHGQKYNVF